MTLLTYFRCPTSIIGVIEPEETLSLAKLTPLCIFLKYCCNAYHLKLNYVTKGFNVQLEI